MGAQNTIELNGTLYDARTGKMLSSVKPSKSAVPSVDGFHRSKPSTTRSLAKHASKHIQKSQTLMRSVVQKPQPLAIKAKGPAPHHTEQGSTKIKGTSVTPIDQRRLDKATKTKRSSLISKFHFGETKLTSTLSPLPVKDVPETSVLPVDARIAQTPEFQSVIPNHLLTHGQETFLGQALENAQSHTEKPQQRKRATKKLAEKLRVSNRFATVGVGVVIAMTIGGFFLYKNVPDIAMRVAAARSGVKGDLPNYQPSGFAINGPIQYNPGEIIVNYKSSVDERSFTVTQKTSEWSSETLLHKFVAQDRKTYQTFEDKGKTIYIYDGSNATWVDSGVWYQIEGASALNSDQLLRIANSIK